MKAIESSHAITHDESHFLALLALCFFLIFQHMNQGTSTLHIFLYSIIFVIMATLKMTFFKCNWV